MQKNLTIILTAMLLSACTNAEVQEYRMNHGMSEATETREKCLAQVISDKKYTPIVAHIPISKDYTPALSELNNNNKPTTKEVELISDLRDASIGCEKALVQSLTQYVPSIAPIFTQMQNETNDNYSQLINRKITWGKFAKEEQKIKQKGMALAGEKWQQIQAQLADQKMRESVQMQNALNNAALINLRQQEIQAQQNQNRMLNCSSYQQGYYIHTNCF